MVPKIFEPELLTSVDDGGDDVDEEKAKVMHMRTGRASKKAFTMMESSPKTNGLTKN